MINVLVQSVALPEVLLLEAIPTHCNTCLGASSTQPVLNHPSRYRHPEVTPTTTHTHTAISFRFVEHRKCYNNFASSQFRRKITVIKLRRIGSHFEAEHSSVLIGRWQ